jgi:methyl-accepting chemotaxis protein
MIGVVALISGIILFRSNSMHTRMSVTAVDYMARMYAEDVQRRFERYTVTVSSMAQIMMNYEAMEADVRRARYNPILYSVLEGNPGYVGIFTAWKPNAVDGLDAEYANTPGTDASGQFITWYHRQDGRITLQPFDEYRTILADATKEITITSPTWREVDGKQVLVVDVYAPILSSQGELAGIVGVNVNISPVQQIVNEIKPYETGIATLYANDGIVAGHAIAERTGKNMRETDRPLYTEKTEAVAEAIRTGQSMHFPA